MRSSQLLDAMVLLKPLVTLVAGADPAVGPPPG
jgi:hypothetical protein